MIATLIYVMCALTSLGCAVMLLRAYRQTKTTLLFWSGWCFAALALSNAVLVIDLVVVTEVNLSIPRSFLTLGGLGLLLYGLVWHSR
jgi:hypothetical protein